MKKSTLVITLMLLVSTIMPTTSFSNTEIAENPVKESTTIDETETLQEGNIAIDKSSSDDKQETTAPKVADINNTTAIKQTEKSNEEKSSPDSLDAKNSTTNSVSALQAASSDAGMTYRTGETLSSTQYLEDIHATVISGQTATADFSKVNTAVAGTYPVKIQYKDSSNKVVQTLDREIKMVVPLKMNGYDSRGSYSWTLNYFWERYYVYADTYHQKIKVLDAITDIVSPSAPDAMIHTHFENEPYYKLKLYQSNVKNVVLEGQDTVRASLPLLEDWSYNIGDYYEIHCQESGKLADYAIATMENKPTNANRQNMLGTSSEISGGSYLKFQMSEDGFIYVDTIKPKLNVAHTNVSLDYNASITEEEFLELAGVTYSDNMDKVNQSGDSVTVTTDFDQDTLTNSVGNKTVNIKVTDDEGNFVEKSVTVTVSATDITADDGMTYRTGATLSSKQYLEDIHATKINGLTATADLSDVNVSRVGTYTVPIQYKDSEGAVAYELESQLSVVEPIYINGLAAADAGDSIRYYIYADAYHQKIKLSLGGASYSPFNVNFSASTHYVKFSLKEHDGAVKKSVTLDAQQKASVTEVYASVNDWDYELGDYYQIDHLEGDYRLVNEPDATIANKPFNPSESNMSSPSFELNNSSNDAALTLEMIDSGFKYVDTKPPTATADNAIKLEYKQSMSEEAYYDAIHLTLADNMFDSFTMSADDFFTVESDYDTSITNNRSGTYPVTIHVEDESGNWMRNSSTNKEITRTNTITMQTTLPTADAVKPNKNYTLGTDISTINPNELVENLDSSVSFVNDVEVIGWDSAHTPSSNTVGTKSAKVLIEDDRGVQASIPVDIGVNYGDSLYFAASGANRGGVVFTLTDDDNSPTLALTAGDNDGTTAFDSSDSNAEYLSTTFYHRSSTTGPITVDTQYGTVAVNKGDKLADYVTKYDAENIASELRYGDIIAVDYDSQDHVTRYDDSVAHDDTTSGETIYYEVTKEGFEPLTEPFGTVQFDQNDGPNEIAFETTRVGEGLKTIHRDEANYSFSVLDTRYQKGWKVYVGISEPLTSSTGDTLDGAIIWKSSNGTETTLTPGNAIEVGSLASTTDESKQKMTFSFGAEEGPLLKYNTSAVSAGNYATTFDWSIVDAP
ncbi:LapB repeat-containing protein [Listeria seeligeri]|uniref:LapB repeat-containing protein n=1 Tax=Listeria seeligeri TaxID=1640 RepID=UPI001887DE27|nr:LapB repeat-containing protein [Listeria seeligeri]MBF2452360.1 LapB repeat-containing protein [Listeria seeligeri]MBF2668350.1 LapB repeat-containing protein [Listeria seeligeri]